MLKKAIIVGSSGLIGSQLVRLISNNNQFSEVLLLVRHPVEVNNSKIKQLVINFDELLKYSADIKGDIIFSCIGTTRYKTPDADLYTKIDMTYPLEIARLGLLNGVTQFHIVTSLNSNPNSSSSYLRLKAKIEEELKKMNYPGLHIYQPSYLYGDRKETRIADKIMKPLSYLIDPLLFGSLKKYKSIKAEKVAKAMINQSLKNLKGIFTYPSIQIQELA
jgi:dTDP-4-dehydrorhamnose reductase